MEARLHEAAFHLVAAQRVRSVKHHYFNVVLRAGPHHQAKRADESVGTAADVLDVIDDNVKSLKHLLARLAVGSVDGIDRDSGLGILEISDMGAGIGIAADPVLRGEKRLEVDFRSGVKDVDGGAEIVVDAARIGHQSDILTHKSLKTTTFQHLDPGAYNLFLSGLRGKGRQCGNGEQDGEYSFDCVHIFIDYQFVDYFLPYSGSILRSARKVTTTVAMQQTITIQKKPL